MNPKVLVACPTYDGMKYCFEKFSESIKSFDYDNYKILIVDNSDSDDFFGELQRDKEIISIKDKSNYPSKLNRLINSRNIILKFAQENKYDFIFMLDADVIAPKETIKELLSQNKDIVSGLYRNYFMVDNKIQIMPVAWMAFTEEEFNEIKKRYSLPDSVKTRFSMRRYMTEEEVSSNEVLEAFHPSCGCMMISKNVFEKIRYELHPAQKSSTTSDDIGFIESAKKAGFKIYVDTKIKCNHLVSGKFIKDADGNLVHPLAYK